MDKSKKPAAERKEKSLATKVAEAVQQVLGKAQTRTTVSTYSSESRMAETTDGGGAAEPPGNASTTLVITDATEKATEKAAPKAPEAPAAPVEKERDGIGGKLSATDVGKVIEPVTAAVMAIDSRLEKLEGQSVGSRRVKSLPTVSVSDNGAKFPEFVKFLAQISQLSPGQKLTKATITTSGWTYGLSLDEANAFLDYIVNESVLLKRVRTERMNSKTKNIDTVGLGGTVLVKATPGVDPGDTVSLSGPTQIQLSTEEVIGIVSVGDDTLEDNIEGEAFVQHLLPMIGAAAANELEQAAMHGDTGVADTGILDRWDGWYKLAKAGSAHVTEGMADADRYWPGTNGGKATKLLKSLPTKYRQDIRNLAWIQHSDLYLDYNEELASKGYSEAWSAITGIRDVPLRGIQNLQMPLLKTDMGFTYSSTPYTDGTIVMLTDLRNLIVGIQRDVRIEPYRQPRKRATDFVLTMRAAVQIENTDAIAIYDHAAVKA